MSKNKCANCRGLYKCYNCKVNEWKDQYEDDAVKSSYAGSCKRTNSSNKDERKKPHIEEHVIDLNDLDWSTETPLLGWNSNRWFDHQANYVFHARPSSSAKNCSGKTETIDLSVDDNNKPKRTKQARAVTDKVKTYPAQKRTASVLAVSRTTISASSTAAVSPEKLPKHNASSSVLDKVDLRSGVEGRSMVGPPVFPRLDHQVIKGEYCTYCKKVGKNCMREQFGKYCIGVVYRYYRENRYSRIEAKKRFVHAYAHASDFKRFLKSGQEEAILAHVPVHLPKCLEYCDLIYVLNMIDWERMTAQSRRLAGYCSRDGWEK